MKINRKKLRKEIIRAFRKPSKKQKEAYGRLLHTLCAACAIGAITTPFTSGLSPLLAALFFVVQMTSAVVLLISGALFCKGK